LKTVAGALNTTDPHPDDLRGAVESSTGLRSPRCWRLLRVVAEAVRVGGPH